MKSEGARPVFQAKKGQELALPGPSLAEFISGVLSKGALFRFRVKGFSMSPFIKEGDVVTLSGYGTGLPRWGDVVAFVHTQTGKFMVHRIIEKKGRGYLIKGDNCPQVDGVILRSNILAYVDKVERDGRRVYFGLGPEKLLIALTARVGFGFRLVSSVRKSLCRTPIFPSLGKVSRYFEELKCVRKREARES